MFLTLILPTGKISLQKVNAWFRQKRRSLDMTRKERELLQPLVVPVTSTVRSASATYEISSGGSSFHTSSECGFSAPVCQPAVTSGAAANTFSVPTSATNDNAGTRAAVSCGEEVANLPTGGDTTSDGQKSQLEQNSVKELLIKNYLEEGAITLLPNISVLTLKRLARQGTRAYGLSLESHCCWC